MKKGAQGDGSFVSSSTTQKNRPPVLPLALKILDVECAYGATKVLNGVTFSIGQGDFVGIIGPNGSGKSTLLRCISRVLKPTRGAVMLEGQDLYSMAPRNVARQMAIVPQETAVNYSFTVEEIIMMGRSPHLRRFQTEGEKDFAIVRRAMELTNTQDLAGRPVTALSGGERQRVIIAKALAQEPEIILLDEPTSHLDINHQIEILGLLKRLNKENGVTVVSVFHDLNLAAEYCQRLILMQGGRVFDLGRPETVLTAANIKEVYGAGVLIRKNPATGRPAVMLLAHDSAGVPGKGKVHVVCGGGAGAAMLGLLVNCGYEVTAGVLNAGDIDWEAGKLLQLEMVVDPPFSTISEDSHVKNLELIEKAEACVMASIPFGHGNLNNLEAASLARDWGKPVLLVEEQTIGARDFTDGQATLKYNELKEKGAVVVKDVDEVPGVLPGLLGQDVPV